MSLVKHELPARCTLRLELVLCGKPKCSKLHGPYWYGYFEERGGRTRKVYIGRRLPEELAKRRLRAARHLRGSAHDAKLLELVELDDD